MMEKRTSRRSINYGKVNEERQAKDEIEERNHHDVRKTSCDTDSLIADMAQGFIQAQAKVTNNATSFTNKDIIFLLEKVNSQLEEMKNSNDDNKKDSAQTGDGSKLNQKYVQENSTNSKQDSSNGQADKELLTELKTLVSAMLQGKNNSGENPSKSQNVNDKKSDIKKQQQDSMAAQTVSQVLAQTQYELANELESSLQKLRQVISKSEQIATNISHLLGEENIKKS
jgi:predicted transcriptional regulator